MTIHLITYFHYCSELEHKLFSVNLFFSVSGSLLNGVFLEAPFNNLTDGIKQTLFVVVSRILSENVPQAHV